MDGVRTVLLGVAASYLASPAPGPVYIEDDSSGIGPGGGGFWVVVAMILAGVLLWRSLRRHVGNIDLPEDPDASPRPKTRPEVGDE